VVERRFLGELIDLENRLREVMATIRRHTKSEHLECSQQICHSHQYSFYDDMPVIKASVMSLHAPSHRADVLSPFWQDRGVRHA
jgi:hypothetical protein